jgi:peptide/nickel transport system permease protein
VPIATVVGTTAAYFGGRVDSLLMRYVDLQQVIPAFFVYLVVQFLYGGSVFLLVLVFGLLNWGGVARLVRSDALEEVESGYVKAAESAGHGRLRIVRRHLLPNVSSTVLTAVTLQIPTLLIIEATVSYLDLGARTQLTWGLLIAGGFTENTFPSQWWIAASPVLALILTTVSFSVLGDALRDALDLRGGQ